MVAVGVLGAGGTFCVGDARPLVADVGVGTHPGAVGVPGVTQVVAVALVVELYAGCRSFNVVVIVNTGEEEGSLLFGTKCSPQKQ